MVDKTVKEGVYFDWNYCKGCGICANECPKQCISMIPEGGEQI
ncbi:4Fe-4S binding domain protein [Blautia hydrogenotrophica DSM 10507]|uniref:4Fe-4S ferredoxin-type domain-containing protein n=1 Tax=Blautia hydrogenotrophica (strain DSM 10507 / JCM 14656 / S5a33) TaxID=476272 RepID=C0CJZ9_BLAHS|nr:4Fe-4S binding domain protein [Blautia hydrogenotrophica DSM 10507]